MPRQGRIDFPGALHHVIVRGINKAAIFYDDHDRRKFIRRLSKGIKETKLLCYAWSLIPNHFHFLLQTVSVPLEKLMRSLLTGYAISFNRRHKRVGYLFQDRYKSILCDSEEYLLQLVRYIHLNPLRAKLVSNIDELDKYPWCGHSALMGNKKVEWQETNEILRRFGSTLRKARRNYRNFVIEGISEGRRPELTGGGLVRSAGGWESVKRLKKSHDRWRGDERILGNGDFVQEVLEKAEAELKKKEQRELNGWNLDFLLEKVLELSGADRKRVLTARRDHISSQARSLFAYWATEDLGFTFSEVAAFLSIDKSAVLRASRKGELVAVRENMETPVKKL